VAKNNLDVWFARTWMRRGPAACLLLPISLLFALLSGLRRALFRLGVLKSERLPVPVIVVGNVFVGGTGKTPLTIWLVQALREAGFYPGVISRGHGAAGDGEQLIDATSVAQQVGDEPLLIWQRTQCPMAVGRNRVATGRALLAAHPQVDVILSDDGLQHYKLQRDIEIVLSDTRGNGNGWLLPAGPLREPASRRRDFSVVNAEDRAADWPIGAFHMRVTGLYVEQLIDRRHRVSLTGLRNAQPSLRIAAAAGIGNPERFFGMLRAAGLTIQAIPLPDHFDFHDFSFTGVQADRILITEKDAVKCRDMSALRDDPRLWVVPVDAHIDGALAERIVEKLRGHPTA
jgi:tetraacyldisaccharide 4'-kinase